jgi:hypothetical protein
MNLELILSNDPWTQFLQAYFFQLLLMAVGVFLELMFVVSRDEPPQPTAATAAQGAEQVQPEAEAEADADEQTQPPKELIKIWLLEFPPPYFPRALRRGLMISGFVLIAVGLVWMGIAHALSPARLASTPEPTPTAAVQPTATPASPAVSATLPPPVSLVSLRYVTDGWDPRMVDLRTASTSGIPVTPGRALQLLDLWVGVSHDAPEYLVQAEVYVRDQFIGCTSGERLVASAVQLGDVTANSFQHDVYTDAWRVQEDWTDLVIVLVTYRGDDVIGRTRTTIHLNPNGASWIIDPPNLNFASIVYAINDGPPLVLDLRSEDWAGLDAGPGDILTILEIWYHSNAEGGKVYIDCHMKKDISGTDHTVPQYTDSYEIQDGIHQLDDLTLSLTIPDDMNFLVLKLVRDDATVMQTLILSLDSQESPGLIHSSEAVLWPFDRSTFLDFERDSDFADWESDVADFRPSSDYAFTGRQSLQVSFPVTETSPKLAFTWWDQPFTADVLVAHYYLPLEPNVYIEWLQFCITRDVGWSCKFIPHTRDRWQTVAFDFSHWPEGADPPLNQTDLYLVVQGRVVAPGATEPVLYSIYMDAIQIFEDDNP